MSQLLSYWRSVFEECVGLCKANVDVCFSATGESKSHVLCLSARRMLPCSYCMRLASSQAWVSVSAAYPIPLLPPFQARSQQELISAANSQLAGLRSEHDQLLDLLSQLDAEKTALQRENERLAGEVSSLRSFSETTPSGPSRSSGQPSQGSAGSADVAAVKVRTSFEIHAAA